MRQLSRKPSGPLLLVTLGRHTDRHDIGSARPARPSVLARVAMRPVLRQHPQPSAIYIWKLWMTWTLRTSCAIPSPRRRTSQSSWVQVSGARSSVAWPRYGMRMWARPTMSAAPGVEAVPPHATYGSGPTSKSNGSLCWHAPQGRTDPQDAEAAAAHRREMACTCSRRRS